jgi:hypothetical protein
MLHSNWDLHESEILAMLTSRSTPRLGLSMGLTHAFGFNHLVCYLALEGLKENGNQSIHTWQFPDLPLYRIGKENVGVLE